MGGSGLQARQGTPASSAVPALRGKVTLRPIEASKSAVCYVRNTSGAVVPCMVTRRRNRIVSASPLGAMSQSVEVGRGHTRLCQRMYHLDRVRRRHVSLRPQRGFTAVSRNQNVPFEADDRPGNLLALALLAPVVGAAAGLVGALFRLALEKADRMRDALIGGAHGEHLLGFLAVAGACAAATLVAASLVRRFSPYASGSGIPHVEAVLNEEAAGSAVSHHSGEVRRRGAGDRVGTGARS